MLYDRWYIQSPLGTVFAEVASYDSVIVPNTLSLILNMMVHLPVMNLKKKIVSKSLFQFNKLGLTYVRIKIQNMECITTQLT